METYLGLQLSDTQHLEDSKADVRHATKSSNFVAQLYRTTNLPRQLLIFHWQTIAK